MQITDNKDSAVNEQLIIPEHVAIIMDGNGRWAKKQGKPRVFGHNAGMQSLKETVKTCSKTGIKYLTVYAFSTENWKRPEDEVNGIFKIMVFYIKKELDELHRNNVKVNVIGDWSKIPDEAEKYMLYAIEKTKNNTGLVFNIALNYGGRSEITDAFKNMYLEIEKNGGNVDDINEEFISEHMSTRGIPDPDVIIRTGGEMRLSNFLLWQCAYSEFIFTDVYWPDFDEDELMKCIREFSRRNRRYGGL